MTDVVERVQALRQQVEQANRTRTRKEMELDTARAASADALRQLQEEFKVSTPEEARDLLTTLEHDLETELVEIEQSLRRTE